MKNAVACATLFICGIVCLVLITGCTPGRSHTRNTVPKKISDKKSNEAYEEENDMVNDRNEIKVKNRKQDKQYDNEENLSFEPQDESSDDGSLKKEKFYQTGVASWYGREFHGKKTASGENFNMNSMTAAHKTLPFGSIVEVKNMDNGKTVKVKINDRGPYRGKRIIDLSYHAAKSLDIIKSGQTFVGIRVLKKGSEELSSEDDAGDEKNIEPVVSDTMEKESKDISDEELAVETKSAIVIQAGAFYTEKNARNLKRRIEGMTKNPVSVIHDGEFYKVRIKGISSRNEADKFKKRLSKENISSYIMDNY